MNIHTLSEPFWFTEPRQEVLFKKLFLIGPGPAHFFRDACRLMTIEPSFDSGTHLVAHLLREIESAVRAVLRTMIDPKDFPERSKGAHNHSKEIRAILKTLGIEESDAIALAWLRLAEEGTSLATLAHRLALEKPRVLTGEFLETWNSLQGIVEFLLDKFEAKFASIFPTIDSLCEKESPSEADLKILRQHVPNSPVTYGRFFEKLHHWQWVIPLNKNGFFISPPGPEALSDGKGTRLVFWPASMYLKRMASNPEVQDEIIQIILSLPPTENSRVLRDLTEAVLELPADKSVQLVPTMKQWIAPSHGPFLHEPLGQFAGLLAKSEKCTEALELVSSILELSEDPSNPSIVRRPATKIGMHEYQEFLEEYSLVLAECCGVDALDLICDLLDQAVSISTQDSSFEDSSHIWRHAIASGFDWANEPKDYLVNAMRDVAVFLAKLSLDSFDNVLSLISNRNRLIFRRAELYLLANFPNYRPELVEHELNSDDNFDDSGVKREFYEMIERGFATISKEAQSDFIRRVKRGPDVELLKTNRRQLTHEEPTEPEIEEFVEKWKRHYLALIRNHLPEDSLNLLGKLEEKHGEAPSYSSYGRSYESHVGPSSPKTVEELAASVENTINFLRNWKPQEGWREPEPEGLGRVLAQSVSASPKEFSTRANEFKNLDPTYIRGLISGLQEAAKRDEKFDWEEIVELCLWVMNQPRTIPGRQTHRYSADPDWEWTRRAIASLLEYGFQADNHNPPAELKNKIWRLLELLSQDPSPSNRDEERAKNGELDYYHVALGSVRGMALHASIWYGFWVKAKDSAISRGIDENENLKTLLEDVLDVTKEKSHSIRSVLGREFLNLYVLDKQWVVTRLSDFFGKEGHTSTLTDVVWRAFIEYSGPYNEIYALLKHQYSIAIDRLAGAADIDCDNRSDYYHKLAEHLMSLYLGGALDDQDGTKIFERFFAVAPECLREYALAETGRWIGNDKGEFEEAVLDRIEKIWRDRLSAARASEHLKEVRAFGWWFIFNGLDEVVTIELLKTGLQIVPKVDFDHLVLEKLAVLATKFPKDTIECLSLLVDGDTEGVVTYRWRDKARRIVIESLASSDSDAQKKAKELINRMIARGLLDFSDLLN